MDHGLSTINQLQKYGYFCGLTRLCCLLVLNVVHPLTMNKFLFVWSLALVLLIGSCKGTKDTTGSSSMDQRRVVLDEVVVKPAHDGYREAATKEFDLIHTKLEVSFDYTKQYLYGKAELTLLPWFYATDSLVLDAKGFEIKEVSLLVKGKREPLKYAYDKKKINIRLPQAYTAKDTVKVYIDYIAKPNELEAGGSEAITSDKGLYFINPVGKEPGKPRQIWTQGETESSSCWFPTIDKPNQNMTQDIYITADSGYITLSNGLLISSKNNGNGTRTDHWKQKLPHAPYLVMMTIGEFVKVTDNWKGMEVSYYVEKAYEQYARDIFGNTPEMLEFFSERLGFKYPWEKYAQIVVRDYVSGAMENTTANVYFSGVQRTKKELEDANYEYIVAHELIHQWFGDLVTCESWSNLPLNEAFANYGEYLWIEHKYGKLEAEEHRKNELAGYLGEAKSKQVSLIRFYYEDKEDMFDAHSYNKGGLTLNLLRDYLGDDAYFAAIKMYLETHQFQPVEINDLRLAIEKVSGQDWNWFFNQWFLKPGHPVLELGRNYDAAKGEYQLAVKQTQADGEKPIYRLPVKVDVYYADRVDRLSFVVDKAEQTLTIPTTQKPLLVVFDAKHTLPAVIKDDMSAAEYVHQYRNAKEYRAQFNALVALSKKYDDAQAKEVFYSALQHPFWGIRKVAVALVPFEKTQSDFGKLQEMLIVIAETDLKSEVAGDAIVKLGKLEDEILMPVFENVLNSHRFYATTARALEAMYALDSEMAYKRASIFRSETNADLVTTLTFIFADFAYPEDQEFFERQLPMSSGYEKYSILNDYGDFMVRSKPVVVKKALPTMIIFAQNAALWYERYAATQGIYNTMLEYRKILAPDDSKVKEIDRSGVILTPSERTDYEMIVEQLNKALQTIKSEEKDPTLKKRYVLFE